MIASFRSEWFRMCRRPAIWIVAAVLIAVLLTFTYALVWAVFTHPPKGLNVAGTTPAELKRTLYPASWLHTVLNYGTGLGGALALILGVLSAGSDYGWGTFKTVLTQGPGRLRALAGKIAALELLLAVLAAAMLLLGAGASALLVAIDGGSSAWPSAGQVLEALGAAWLILTLYASLGFALAMLFRQSALALGAGLIYTLVVEGLALSLLRAAEVFDPVIRALPGPNTGGLVGAFPTAGPALATPLMGPTQATIVLAAYVAGFVLVSALVFRARDVS